MNYPRRHNRANTAVTHEKSKYDMTSLYRQPMVAGSSPVTSSKELSPLSHYNTWFEGLCIFYICLYALLKAWLFAHFFANMGVKNFFYP